MVNRSCYESQAAEHSREGGGRPLAGHDEVSTQLCCRQKENATGELTLMKVNLKDANHREDDFTLLRALLKVKHFLSQGRGQPKDRPPSHPLTSREDMTRLGPYSPSPYGRTSRI